MQFIVSSSELLKHITSIHGVVPTKSVLPIIQNILFDLKGGRLSLSASDLENSLQTSLAVEAEDNATFFVALPPKILSDTLKALPEQPITLTYFDDTSQVQIKTDNGEYRINGENGADFPRIPNAEDTKSIKMPLNVMVKVIQRTIFAASTDELKPAMTGMLFHFQQDAATFVCTDAHRLIRYRRLDVTVSEEVRFILPVKALKLLTNAAGQSDDTVKIEYNDRNTFFRFGSTVLTCRQIDARFPDFNNVIPADSPNKVILNKKDLLGTMRRLDIYANKTTHLGRFKFTGNLLEVQAEDLDYANEAKENLSCLYEGNDLEIGFNVSLMTDIIANVETEDVVIEMDTPGRAAIVVPNQQDAAENVLMLLMPVMLGTSY